MYFHAFEVLGGAQGSLGVHEEGVWDDLGVVLEGREAQRIALGRPWGRSRVPSGALKGAQGPSQRL